MPNKETNGDIIRLKQALSENSTLVPTTNIISTVAEYNQEQLNKLSGQLGEASFELTDLKISSTPIEDAQLAALAFELSLLTEEQDQRFVKAIEQTEYIEDPSNPIPRPNIQDNYLLFLGCEQKIGEKLDFDLITGVFLSIKHYFRSQVEAQLSAWQALGFEVELTGKNHLDIFISHNCSCANKWLYLLEWLVNEIVTLGRPVDHYSTTFFLTLDLVKNDEVGRSWKESTSDRITKTLIPQIKPYKYEAKLFEKPELDAEHEAWIYFSPHQRRYLFDEVNAKRKYGNDLVSPIREYRLIEPEGEQYRNLEWQLTLSEHDFIRLPIKQVTLYSYFNGMMCLAVHVEQRNELPNQHWVKTLLCGSVSEREQLQDIQYQRYLTFTKNARVIYPPYVAANAEGKHFAKSLYQGEQELTADDPARLQTIISEGDRFRASVLMSRPILFLLAEFFKKQPQALRKANLAELLPSIDERLTNLPDDRMFVSTSYGLVGELPQDNEQQEKIFSYALNVDDKSMLFDEFEDFCYHKPMIKQQLKEGVYQRWISSGTWSGYTDFSHAYLGTSWFFKNMIAPYHVKNIYNRMLLSALFYRTSFEHYNRRITTQTNRLVKNGCIKNLLILLRPPFAKLRRDFILFVNQYWFVELTSQIQGREQLKMMLKPLSIDQQFEQIQSELQSADEYVAANNGRAWGIVALLISAISLLSLLEVAPQTYCAIKYAYNWLVGNDLTSVVGQCSELWPKVFGGK